MDFQTQSIHQQSSNTSNNQQMTTIYNGNAFEYIKTDKNEEGQYECATCEQPFGNQGEVCWADVGEFNYKDGKPLCGSCCDEMRRLDDDEDDCDWFCEGVCGKGFYYGDDHHEEDDEGITNFWCCECYAKKRGRGCGCDEMDEEEEEEWAYDCVVCKKHLCMLENAKCEEREMCWSCCVGRQRGCPCHVCVANNKEEKDELCSAIDASGNCLF